MNSWADARNSPVPNGGMSTQDESALFAPLKSMDKKTLQQLLEDDNKTKEMVSDTPYVRNLMEEKKRVETSTKRLAEGNIASDPPLIEAKASLGQLHKNVQEARNNYNSLKARIDSMSDKHSSGTVLALLQAAAAEIEDKSEEVANRLLTGGIDADKFLEEFLPLRKLCNERRVKAEKMTDLVSRTPAPSRGPVCTGPPPPSNMGQLPYPATAQGSYPMPMPQHGFSYGGQYGAPYS